MVNGLDDLLNVDKPNVCHVGSWNTRQLGAPTGYIDQYLKVDELIDFWEIRKWELVTLVDTKLGAHGNL